MAGQTSRLIAALTLGVLLSAADPKPVVRPKAVRRAAPVLSTHRRIDLLLATTQASNARWGILVVHLKTGRTVYQRNPDEHFTPASNTKLFSTALALERLGPEHRFMTTIRASSAPDTQGVLEGDLRIVGGGDPTLSGRAYPYSKEDIQTNPLEPVEQLAAQLIERGVSRITGDIVGDDRLYIHAPYPEGWTIDDAIWEYGAPVSALPFNDNAFTLIVRPGAQSGDPARLATSPPSLPLIIDNRASTIETGRSDIIVDRAPGSRHITVTGVVALKNGNRRQLLAVDDAALYAAHVFYDVLTRRGVRIDGAPAALHRYSADEPFDPTSGIELARRVSPPLVEVSRVVNKVSQNLHAEILLRETARVRRQQATREAGLLELAEFLTVIGVPKEAYHFEDGSGLSRRTLIAPSAITRLLAHMDSRYPQLWDSQFPIGAEDGTLSTRFDKSPVAQSIHAKTGTLAMASALSGFLTTRGNARLAFSIIANNHTIPSAEIRKVIDRIGLALLDWEGN